jgi:hypothetical protein
VLYLRWLFYISHFFNIFDIQQQIRHEVVNAVAQSQNALMSQLKDLISNEMGKVQDQQQRIAETQITKIEESATLIIFCL